MEQDLTTGSVFKRIVYFSLPYLLSYFLQTLYGMADLFITGQFYGVDYSRIKRQSDHAHDDGHYCGAGNGHNGYNRAQRGRKMHGAGRKNHRQYHYAFYGNCRCIYRHTGCTGKADSGSDSNTAGSSGGNKHISFNLFYRDSVYYRL